MSCSSAPKCDRLCPNPPLLAGRRREARGQAIQRAPSAPATLVRCKRTSLIIRNRYIPGEIAAMPARFRIGIDLGGTKIEGAALGASGLVHSRRRVATPAHDYRATVNSVVAVIRTVEQEIGEAASVGIGIP